MNFLNDYDDHVRGQDRLSPRGGSRAIQKGWITPLQIRRFGHATLLLAAVFGLPALFVRLNLLILIGLVTLVAGLGYSSNRLGLKYRGFGEAVAFLLTGPLLMTGFGWAITGQLLAPLPVLGIVFGLTTAVFYHLANLEDIMINSQANIQTLATRLGFEGSKTLFFVLVAISTATHFVFAAFTQYWLAAGVGLVGHVSSLMPLALRVGRTRSCLSGKMGGLRSGALVFQIATVVGWIVGLVVQSFSFLGR